MRSSVIERNTLETQIRIELKLDGTGKSEINSGCGFLDHMLTLFAKHGRFDLVVQCNGDHQVDEHHTTEDIGICLGIAFREALADLKGVVRYGSLMLPMDEALIAAAVDLSGRSYLGYALEIPAQKVGTFDTELVQEFWLGFTRNACVTLHLRQLAGSNSHHIVEGAFKAAARCLRQAVAVDPACAGEIPSTKGVII
jgi:imidazoleglycerol-phosphate dehydratase